MQKKKISIQEQVKHMKSNGISFKISTEDEAKEFLSNHSYYFKIKAYAKCFRKYINNKHNKYGQYISLDFNQLLVLSKIDMIFRAALLDITLEIEHSLKVYLNKNISENDLEDGYGLTTEFLTKHSNLQQKINNILQYPNSNTYTYDMVKKYQKSFSSWNLVEILTLGDLISFYEFYAEKYNIKTKFEKLLKPVKFVRNAAAHNNCMLNQLNSQALQIKPSKKVRNYITTHIPSISQRQLKRYLTIPVLHDFAACVFSFLYIVKSNNAYQRAVNTLNQLFDKIEQSKDLFNKELNIISGLTFIQNIIIFFKETNCNNFQP